MGASESSQRNGGSGRDAGFLDDPWKALGIVYYPDQDDIDEDDADIDRVQDGLYIGGMVGALHQRTLHKLGVTHVLNMATYSLNPNAHHADSFEYMIVGVEDHPKARISDHFEKTNRFISQGRQRGAVFVHCFAGMSRAPTAVIAFLMAEQGMQLQEALSCVKAARRQTCPNLGFMKQLQEYEVLLASSMSQAGRVQHHSPPPGTHASTWSGCSRSGLHAPLSPPSASIASPSLRPLSSSSPSREWGKPGTSPVHCDNSGVQQWGDTLGNSTLAAVSSPSHHAGSTAIDTPVSSTDSALHYWN